jgi:septal ring factor EnvC (AmiA/AmiB activator)
VLAEELATADANIATLQTQMAQANSVIVTLQQQVFTLQNQMTTANNNIATLQAQVAALQAQVPSGLTFANVVEAVPPGGLSGRFGVTIQGVAMSIGLYAP